MSHILDWLGEWGQIMLLVPVYKGLVNGGKRDEAVATFNKNYGNYHPVLREEIEEIIFIWNQIAIY